MNERYVVVLKKIIQYADEIAFTIKRSDLTFENMASGIVEKNAIAMCILQIGELVGHLSDEFKAEHAGVPWQKIRAMRNIAAHNYGSFDLKILWEVATGNAPELKAYCESILAGDKK